MRMFSWKTRLARSQFHDGPGARGHRHPTFTPLEVRQSWWEKAISRTLLVIGVFFGLVGLAIGLSFAAALIWIALSM